MDLAEFGRWVSLGVAMCGLVLYAWGKARGTDVASLGFLLGVVGVLALGNPVTLPGGVAYVLWHWVSRP